MPLTAQPRGLRVHEYRVTAQFVASVVEEAVPRTPNRSPDREPAKPLPHPRVPARHHKAVIHTLGGLPQPFHVRDLARATGTGVWGIGIAMKFLVQCRLAERVAGPRGTYRATVTGEAVAQAWSVSEKEGQRVLHQAWADLWFTHSARKRLRNGPGMRTGLQLTFQQQVRTPGHETAVNRLIELMTATGFLVEEPVGYVRWHEYEHEPPTPHDITAADEHPVAPPPREASRVKPRATARRAAQPVGGATCADVTGNPPSTPLSPSASTPNLRATAARPVAPAAAAAEAAPGAVPPPRSPGDSTTAPVPLPATAAAELLVREFGMGDLLHLTSEEALALHDHLTALLGILSAMHERSRGQGDSLNATLLTPWTPAAIAASTREDWLNAHHLVRQLAAATPFRRQPTNT